MPVLLPPAHAAGLSCQQQADEGSGRQPPEHPPHLLLRFLLLRFL